MSERQWEDLITRYQAGATTYALAEDYGIHRTTISEHLKAAVSTTAESEPPFDV